ncbi:hypothetical protein DU500_02785 [Haloplanus rubicundus]|uniref:Uncharacterized protein n=1 Tax=Haloplanus rubicundus TaxID=1547898 RepID=A0A345DZS5_9EURY|nr:hypothetical protein [Haloplanus rubicundus]AXG05447.1 hypothetical protein DU500_02785 [Haloplanus rubicundus]
MTSFRSLLVRRRVDAGAAWGVTATLPVAAVVLLRRGEPDWAVFAVLVAGVAVLAGDPGVTVPAELLALSAAPFVVRAAGLLPGVTAFFAAAALTLLVVVVLDVFTSLSMTPRFAAVFVVVATMAVAGLYTAFGWYDSVAHALSASLVAGGGYAVARGVERHSRSVDFDRRFRAAFVVLFVLAIGVGWEILEFASGGLAAVVGGEALLAQYGTADIVNDLVFNAVGAVVVAAGSTARFETLAGRLVGRLDAVVHGGE